jgi:hypothetical protein
MLSVGIFVVVAASLGITRSQQLGEQSRLDNELTITEERLSNLQVEQLRQQQEELQKRLDESTIQLAAAKDGLRQSVESINVTDEFFEVAQSCGVEVMSISSSSIGSENLGDIVCSVITLNAAVQGGVSNLINFVISLNNDFTTGIVKSAQISIPEVAGESKPSAGILMVVYAYEGD